MQSDWINTHSFASLGVFSEKKDVALAFWAGWLIPFLVIPLFLEHTAYTSGDVLDWWFT
jgi:hypothetical protein